MTRLERRVKRRLARLPAPARAELLRALPSPSETRANLIRQMCERPETKDLAEVMMDLEAQPRAAPVSHRGVEGVSR